MLQVSGARQFHQHSGLRTLYCLTLALKFALLGLDVIGQINPKASNGHRFILVAIDYFTKWVEAALNHGEPSRLLFLSPKSHHMQIGHHYRQRVEFCEQSGTGTRYSAISSSTIVTISSTDQWCHKQGTYPYHGDIETGTRSYLKRCGHAYRTSIHRGNTLVL